MSRLALRHIDLGYGERSLFRNLSLDLYPGRAMLLCGDNGAGKSSLLRIIAGLQRADRLELKAPDLRGAKAVRHLRARVTYLHQHPYAFRGSVLTNLKLALPRGLPRRVRAERLDQALAWADLDHLAKAEAIRLSGGERQRLALARAWLRGTPFLLLDEPTANLDTASRKRTLTLLRELCEEGRGLLIATHDPTHFPGFGDGRLLLAAGRLQLARRPATLLSTMGIRS